MKKRLKAIIFYLGILIFAAGLLLTRIIPESAGVTQTLSSAMTGFGAGIIGVGVVNLFMKKMREKNPQKAREYDIAEKDERNIRLREKAGLAAWYITLFMLAILSLAFMILDCKLASLLTMGALLIHVISLFICVYVYNKRL